MLGRGGGGGRTHTYPFITAYFIKCVTLGLKVIVSQDGDAHTFFSSNKSFVYYLGLIKSELSY